MTDNPAGTPGSTTDSGSASERAYLHVKERIITGDLEGGELISEGEIAEQLTMSRTPVREAFLRLQAEGWMRLYPKRGASITPVKPQEADQLIEARALLESHAVAKISADSDRAAQLAGELSSIVDRQQQAAERDDLAGFTIADADFHATIAGAADNDLLQDFYAGLRDRQRRMTRDSVQRSADTRQRILDQHRRLITLIADGDADGFAAEITEHLHSIHRR